MGEVSGDRPEAGRPGRRDTAGMRTAPATDTAARLQGRARRLRTQAASLHPLLADAYRRRAAELDVEAWLEATWNPPAHLDGPTGGPGTHVARPGRPHLAVA